MELIDTLKARKAEIERMAPLIDNNLAKLQQEITNLQQESFRLNGEYRLITSLLSKDSIADTPKVE